MVLKGCSCVNGGVKNIDLVSDFGVDPGFWKSFSEGVEEIQVADEVCCQKWIPLI